VTTNGFRNAGGCLGLAAYPIAPPRWMFSVVIVRRTFCTFPSHEDESQSSNELHTSTTTCEEYAANRHRGGWLMLAGYRDQSPSLESNIHWGISSEQVREA
jgi:hypothetical protein